jgi:hypothetical protein
LNKQRKKGRPRSKSPMVHTAVVLPGDLIERLKKDAATSGIGLSAEIRMRLQTSYDLEGLPADPPTNDLIESIKDLAAKLAGDLRVQWHKHKFALDAFKAGVEVFLRQYDVGGDARASLDPAFTGYPDDAPPDVVGIAHARRILRDRHEEVSQQEQADHKLGDRPA